MRNSPLLRLKWTNDKGMFWASVVGLLIFAATLYYTRELLRSTSESSQRQLRAYLSISEGNLFDVAPGKAPRGVLRLSNSGQTPAYNITARGIMAFKKFEEMQVPVAGIEFRKSVHFPSRAGGNIHHIWTKDYHDRLVAARERAKKKKLKGF